MPEQTRHSYRQLDDSGLREAFEQTRYLVLDRGCIHRVQVGRPTPARLARKCRGRHWAIVTADNPNAIRSTNIRDRLHDHRARLRLYRLFAKIRPRPLLRPTVHRDDRGLWPDERGWWICPASLDLATRIGRSVGQLAIVAGGPARPAEIIECIDRSRHNAFGPRFHAVRRFKS